MLGRVAKVVFKSTPSRGVKRAAAAATATGTPTSATTAGLAEGGSALGAGAGHSRPAVMIPRDSPLAEMLGGSGELVGRLAEFMQLLAKSHVVGDQVPSPAAGALPTPTSAATTAVPPRSRKVEPAPAAEPAHADGRGAMEPAAATEEAKLSETTTAGSEAPSISSAPRLGDADRELLDAAVLHAFEALVLLPSGLTLEQFLEIDVKHRRKFVRQCIAPRREWSAVGRQRRHRTQQPSKEAAPTAVSQESATAARTPAPPADAE